ncbi:MAG TPA: hypothetical protein VFK45_00905, partial [Gammaproteobacteria bacterium]|nr:hypothetical protein [Gammaproteobacteria bacterium]
MTIGGSKVSHQQTPAVFIDKLSITLSLPADEINETTEKVQEAICYTSVFQKAIWSPRFEISRNISLPGTTERVSVRTVIKNYGLMWRRDSVFWGK